MEMMARVSTSDNLFLIQTVFKSKMILKNSGRHSGIYRANIDRRGSVEINGQSQ
jgi:hypothetical protein